MKAHAVRYFLLLIIAFAGVGPLSAQPSPRVGSGSEAQWASELGSRFFGEKPDWQWVPAVQSRRVAPLGDGGWLAEHSTGQVAISLRRRLYVATVSGQETALVERCAKEIVAYLSDQQQGGLREPLLDARIPFADRARYESVRDGGEWRNPRLIAIASGFELTSASNPKPKLVSVRDLRRVLADLPLTDWPYGRVVALSNSSIVEADTRWIREMDLNFARARTILAALGVDESLWPA